MPSIFVISPFGKKLAAHTPGGTLDFDDIFREIVAPACENAGWTAQRVDTMLEPGLINEVIFREILAADLAVVDVSLPNANVFYELGIRQAISPGGTVLIAHAGSEIPFDIGWQRVIFYDLTDPAAARTKIEAAIRSYKPSPQANPIRGFLEKFCAIPTPEQGMGDLERELNGRIERTRTGLQVVAVWQWAKQFPTLPVLPLLTLAARLSDNREWALAVDVLRAAAEARPRDYEICRQLGWYLQKLGPEREAESMECLLEALKLNPGDPETLGMIGGSLKRRGAFAEAAEYYNRAVAVSPENIYVLVNQAAVTILAHPENPAPGVELYRKLLAKTRDTRSSSPDVWSELVLAECKFAIGDISEAMDHFREAAKLATSPMNLQSAARQIELFDKAGFRREAAAEILDLLRELTAQPGTEPKIEPAPAVSVKPTDSRPVIIHISDVHFGHAEKNGHRKDVHRFFEGENSQPLSKHLLEEFRYQFQIDRERIHLVVSGDLTYSAEEKEFQQVEICLNEVCSGLGISRDRVHIVPGNHDVNWDLAKHNKTWRFDHYISFLESFYGEQLCRQKYPSINWPIRLNAPRPQAHEISFVTHDASAGLLIAGFNSCVYENEQHHYGFVGERQTKLVRDLLRATDVPRETLRVAILHHHLHPFPELLTSRDDSEVWQDLSTVRDAGFVERSLEKLGFDLVLHGHKHKAQVRETLVRDPAYRRMDRVPENRLIVCGAGSVSCLELEHNESNHYEVIEVLDLPRRSGSAFLRVHWRVLPLAPGAEWSTSQTWDVLG